mgnify:CR=1 FL=1|tara:strand:+ start:803 stop:1417 length:615 start_codon:yes stop_codon:yes gene_type:complete
MGDVTFTHDRGRARETVARRAVRAQSIVLGDWFEETRDNAAVGTADPDGGFAMDDLKRTEFDAFVRHLRGQDLALARRVAVRAGRISGPDSSDHVEWYDGATYARDVALLVRPAHKYDCAILWNRIVRTVNTSPTAPLIAALDNLGDVSPAMWMGDNVVDWCCQHSSGTESWSDALCAAVFKHSRMKATAMSADSRTPRADRAT